MNELSKKIDKLTEQQGDILYEFELLHKKLRDIQKQQNTLRRVIYKCCDDMTTNNITRNVTEKNNNNNENDNSLDWLNIQYLDNTPYLPNEHLTQTFSQSSSSTSTYPQTFFK